MKRIPLYATMLLGIPLNAQYISEVLSYTPAPGQFINKAPWGVPHAAETIAGGVGGSLSLGVFGGEVIFRFSAPVENHPDNPFGVDFTLFGNALPHWSEPGVVWVMKDDNENGVDDDTWYELAGSDYFFSSTLRNCQVTYRNPGGTSAADVPWEDLSGASGVIKAVALHTQPYYPLPDSFPHIPDTAMLLAGTRIEGAVRAGETPMVRSLKRGFGYADNTVRGTPPYTLPDNPYTEEVENSGGDAFDIDWAVDAAGSYVNLDEIDFVRVQSAVLYEGGWLGEISTEITGGVDVPPNPGMAGNRLMVVIRDLPEEISQDPLQMEVFSFEGGRLVPDSEVLWTSSQSWARVNDQHMLLLEGTGPLTLTARMASYPEITASVSTTVAETQSVSPTAVLPSGVEGNLPVVYPNPARKWIRIKGAVAGPCMLYHSSGIVIRSLPGADARKGFGVSDLAPGLYLIQVGYGTDATWLRFVKL